LSIDTDDLDNMSRRDLVELLEAYNESLAEIKRLRGSGMNWKEIVKKVFEARDKMNDQINYESGGLDPSDFSRQERMEWIAGILEGEEE